MQQMSHMTSPTVTTVTPRQVPDTLEALIRSKYPFFLLGNQGIGKSDMVGQTLARLGMGMLDLRGATMDPVDARGVPWVESLADGTRMTRWARPEIWPTQGAGCIFLDEFNRSPLPVMNALMNVLDVNNRAIAGHKIPDAWTVGAAGNNLSDKGVNAMGPALRDRFTFLQVVVDNDDWTDWALMSGKIEPVVVAFLRLFPNLLSAFDDKALVNPSPRSWERASALIAQHNAPSVQHVLLAGTVGEEAAVKFAAFEPVFKHMPSVDAILADPTRADVPGDDKPGLRIALATALAFRATEDNFSQVITYLERMPGEYGAYSTSAAIARDKDLQHTREYMHYAVKNNIADRYN
jgi:hypothetical protein